MLMNLHIWVDLGDLIHMSGRFVSCLWENIWTFTIFVESTAWTCGNKMRCTENEFRFHFAQGSSRRINWSMLWVEPQPVCPNGTNEICETIFMLWKGGKASSETHFFKALKTLFPKPASLCERCCSRLNTCNLIESKYSYSNLYFAFVSSVLLNYVAQNRRSIGEVDKEF